MNPLAVKLDYSYAPPEDRHAVARFLARWPTTGKIKGIMHAVYECGLFEEQVASNPCDGWRLKGVMSTYTAITITPQQTLMILRSLTDRLHFALVFTVAATALRASEVIALRWADNLVG